jgi:hypothetical protein
MQRTVAENLAMTIMSEVKLPEGEPPSQVMIMKTVEYAISRAMEAMLCRFSK